MRPLGGATMELPADIQILLIPTKSQGAKILSKGGYKLSTTPMVGTNRISILRDKNHEL